MAEFVLSDERVKNSYGFYVATNGIGLSRFKRNPVMLSEHNNSVGSVLGRWKNITKHENGKLSAEDEFDLDDEDAKKIAGKVERGFIKGVSIGMTFNPDDMKRQPDGSWLLTKCELMEASICAVPSNPNALRLYAESGELLSGEQIKLALHKDGNAGFNLSNLQKQSMKKVILTLSALTALDLQKHNTPEGVDADAVSAGIDKLKAELDKSNASTAALKLANETMSRELQAQMKVKVDALIDNAIAQGKLSAIEKESWTELATGNYVLAEKTLAGIPAKKSLAGTVSNPDNGNAVKTDEDFQKLSLAEQLAWKEANPEAYSKLFA